MESSAKPNRSPLLVIFITVFIDLVGFGIVIPVLPLYVEGAGKNFHGTPRQVALLFASYSVMQLIFTPILGRLSDKYGRRPVLLFSLIGTGFGFLILGMATTMWMLFAGRILDGITGGNISTAQAYIADVTTIENRAKGMGLIGAAFGLGFIFGPAIGGLLSHFGMHVPFLFAAGLAFCNSALLYFTLPESLTPELRARALAQHQTEGRWSRLLRSMSQSRMGLILMIYFLLTVAFSIMTAIFSLFTLARFRYDATRNGWLFAFIGVIAAVVQGGLFGRLTKIFGEAALVVVGSVLLAGGLILLPLVGPDSGGLLMLLLILGAFAVGNSFASPALTSLTSKGADASAQGATLGVTQSAASLARAVGPALAALLISTQMTDQSILRTFWTAAGITIAACILAAYFSVRYSGQIAGEKTETNLGS